jgi:hypothetical protein
MNRPVVVAGLGAEDGKYILVVVCLNPPEAYASKNDKNLGFIVEGKFVPNKKAVVSQADSDAILAAYAVMKVALDSLPATRELTGA